MNTYITIDGGTSSTRVNFLKNGEISAWCAEDGRFEFKGDIPQTIA